MDSVSASFDSRYFGPVASAAIIGKLVPIWTR
jgi:type IV secretory pathway protease TraF